MKNVILVIVFMCISSVYAEEISISKTEVLKFDIPNNWKFEQASEPDDQFRPSFKFSHFSAGVKDFGFKFFINKNKSYLEMIGDKEKIDYVKIDCNDYMEGSVEGSISVKTYKAPRSVYYCSFTDASLVNLKKLPPGEFANVTVAFVTDKDFGFTSVAYSNGLSGPLFSDFLKTLASITVIAKEN